MKNQQKTERKLEHPSLAAFNDWLERYLSVEDDITRRELEAEGLSCARRRAHHMRTLIECDPGQALAAAISAKQRAQLPSFILMHVEVHVEGQADVVRTIRCKFAGHPDRIELEARVGDIAFTAHVAGHTAELPWLKVPIKGVALGSELAFAALAPSVPDQTGRHQRGLVQAVQAASGGLPPRVNILNQIRCLVIRVCFPDEGGEPISRDRANAAMTECDQYFRAWSRGRTWLAWDVSVTCYTLNRGKAAYAFDPNGVWALHADARAQAAQDYPEAYDKVLVVFPGIRFVVNPDTGILEHAERFDFRGLADVPGRLVWLNGQMDAGLVMHELGHSFGLYHANRWETHNSDVVGPGFSHEYGDLFDTMGGDVGGAANGVTDARHYFNPLYLYALGWRDSNEILPVAVPGDYTVRRFDHAGASGVQALVIAREPHYYWIGLRGSFTQNTDISSGAYIIWGGPSLASLLLDFSPQSRGFADAALDQGQLFSDERHGITLEVLEHGGIAPDEYIRIRVGFPPALPTIIAQPQAVTAGIGSTPQLRVEAAGSRPLHYEWRINGMPVSFGADDAVLVFPPLSDADAGVYTVVVRNEFGEVESVPVELTVIHAPPRLLRRSRYRNVCVAPYSSVTFSVEIESDLPVSYTWMFTGNPGLSGQQNSVRPQSGRELTLTDVQAGQEGRYVCVATTSSGAVRVPFLLKVLPAHTGVACWGSNEQGALDAPYNIGYVTAVGAGDQYSVALKSDGQLVAWGNGRSTAELSTLTEVVAIAIGDLISWALRADGTVWEWSAYIAPRPVAGFVNIIAISVHRGNFIVLRDDGTVAFRHLGSVPDYPAYTLTNVADISAGTYHGAALLNDDSVRIWGLPATFDPPGGTLTDAVAIACGDSHALILKSDGTLLGVGGDSASLPPPATQEGWLYSVLDIAAGSSHSLAIRLHPHMPAGGAAPQLPRLDRVVDGWGDNASGQATVAFQFSNIWGIAAGRRHSLGIVPFMRG